MAHRARGRGVRTAGWLAVVVLIVAACSGGADAPTAGTEVLPIDDVIDGEVTVVPDPSGTTAVVEVTTTIPVACAVVYGADETFGGLAVDDDMRGGAHEDHRPVLTGLQPDTEYRYVLQGSDTTGALYRGEVMTFRTPPADEVQAPGPNVATSGSVVAASSEFSDAFAAANAFDGDLGTEWSSAGDGDDAWIELDLGEAIDVVGLEYRTREMTDGTAIVETYTVTVDDGEVLGPFDAGTAVTDLDVTGRRLRFDAETTTGGNTGAVDIAVYAAP